MFTDLFLGLREAKVPVSLREYLTLLEAMDKRLVQYDVEGFYYLARSALVKDERNIDKFDRVFSEVFKGLEAVSGAPEWCTSRWCFINAENCTRPMSPADLVMVNGEATGHELSLSYETCGNLNAYRCSVLR